MRIAIFTEGEDGKKAYMVEITSYRDSLRILGMVKSRTDRKITHVMELHDISEIIEERRIKDE